MIRLIAPFRDLRALEKTAFRLAAAILLYGVLGFLIAPPLLKAVLEERIPLALHRQVAIEKIRLNPFTLAAEIEGVRLAQKEGPGAFVSFDRLAVNFEALSLFRRALIVKSIRLTGPTVALSRLDERTFNFSDLFAPSPAKAKQQEQSPALFSINDLEIINGTIRYQDLPKGVAHEVIDLHLAIPSISNLPSHVEATVRPAFSAVVNGTQFSLAGGSKPFAKSRATELKLKASGIDIPEYLAHLPNPTGLTVTSALLDLDTKLSYWVDRTSRLSLSGTVTLREVEVADREGLSYLSIPSLTAVLTGADLLARNIGLAEIAIDGPHLQMARLPGGRILPLSLLAAAESASPEEQAKAAATRATATKATATKATAKKAAVTKPPAADRLKMTIGRFRLVNGTLTFTDRTLEKPAAITLEQIGLTAGPLSTIPGTATTIDVSLGVNATGRLSGKGTLTFAPLNLKTRLDIDSLPLAGFQPYLAEQARVLLSAGTLALHGALEVKPDAAGAPKVSFAGHGAVAGLTAADAVSGEDLLKWKELQVRNMVLSSSPVALAIGEIRLQEPFAKVLVNADGTSNLATLVRTDRQADPADGAGPKGKTAEPSPPRITVAKVAIQDGTVLFQDRSVQPAYGAGIGQLNGVIAGLSSRQGRMATVKLDGRIDLAPLALFGQVNLLSESPFADLTLDFKDFNLSPLSPYSGKYIGRKIEKGKLSFGSLYRIRGNRLESRNKVFLDQFTLGEHVESPDATSLPVGLAVALLQNRKGEIVLDLPVHGDRSDPEFSTGGVVLKALANVAAKAATSPFALLGGLIPQGKDMQHVLFEPGRAELTGEAAAKLALMADVLHERPGLRMDIAGHSDLEIDREALGRARLLHLVKLEKLRKTGSRKGTADQAVAVSAEEYPKFLKRAYKRVLETASPSEKALARQANPANDAEENRLMEEFVLRAIKIRDEDLRLLALDRANAVVGQLASSGKTAPGQLFVIEPKLAGAGAEQAQGPRTMVELIVK